MILLIIISVLLLILICLMIKFYIVCNYLIIEFSFSKMKLPKVEEPLEIESLSAEDLEAWRTNLGANYNNSLEAARNNGFTIKANDRIELEVARDIFVQVGILVV